MTDHHRPPGRARPARDDDETREIKTPGGDSLTAAQADTDTAPAYTIREAVATSSLEANARHRDARDQRLEELLEEFKDEIDPEATAVDRYIEELEDLIDELRGSDVGSDK